MKQKKSQGNIVQNLRAVLYIHPRLQLPLHRDPFPDQKLRYVLVQLNQSFPIGVVDQMANFGDLKQLPKALPLKMRSRVSIELLIPGFNCLT
jgi:hypothetical protein